jgi:hypothetical protein
MYGLERPLGLSSCHKYPQSIVRMILDCHRVDVERLRILRLVGHVSENDAEEILWLSTNLSGKKFVESSQPIT